MSTVQFDFEKIAHESKVTPDLIASVKDRIVQNLHPEKVVLFGSYANGTATDGSDIDLLVVLDDKHPLASHNYCARLDELLELFRYRLFGLDALILTHAEIQQRQDENEEEWDLVLEILEEGKILYERVSKTQTQ